MSGPANASPSPKTPSSSDQPVELRALIDPAGKVILAIPKQVSGFYIGSWQKADGVWNSPDEVVADVRELENCVANYANSFASTDAFQKNISQLSKQLFNSSGQVNVSVLLTYGNLMNCLQSSQYATYMIENLSDVITSKGALIMPYEKLAQGNSTIFIASLTQTSDPKAGKNCESMKVNDVDSVLCDLRVEKLDYLKVREPELTLHQKKIIDARQLQSLQAFASPTGFERLKRLDFGLFKDPTRLIGPVTAALSVTTVFAVLISLPTSLLETSLEANRLRIERFFQRRLPKIVRRRQKHLRILDSGASETSGAEND
jgi:hypothetical protein